MKYFYYNNGDYILWNFGRIEYKLNTNCGYFNLYGTFTRLLSKHNLIKRLLRLHRLNVIQISDDFLMIIFNHKVMRYDLRFGKLQVVLEMPFSRYLHDENIIVRNELIILSEYGNSGYDNSVGLWVSDNLGLNWTYKKLFKPREVKNILSIHYDKYSKTYLISTGDNVKDCMLLEMSEDLDKIEIIGKGIMYRAISFHFTKENIYWFMNNPFGDSYALKLHRESKEITKVFKFDGPVWYSRTSATHLFISTAAEKSHLKSFSRALIYKTDDLVNWTLVSEFEKDIWNNKYFLNGLITFSRGGELANKYCCYFDALKSMDGKIRWNEKS